MNTNHKLGAVREIALVGRLLRATVIATAVFALAFVVAPYIIAEANAANDVSSTISWSAIDLTLDPDVVATQGGESPDLATHGNVEFGDIVPTAKNTTAGDYGDYGTLKVQRKTIGVTTRGKYYTVFLSMEGSNQNLNLTYNNTTDTNIKIAKTSGTWTTPVTLATNGTSGWGYMVPGSTISGGFSSLTQGGMRDIFTASKLDTALYQTDGVAYTESLWAAVPASTAPQQIWKNTTSSNSGFSSRDTFDVYYGVNVDTDVLSGTYQNRVIYTALASAASLDEVSYNLVRTVKYGTSGDTETLYFDLAQIGTPVTANKLEVKMVPHSELAASGVDFDPSKLSSAVLSAALECDVDESSFETVTATTNGGSTSKVNCTVPAGTVAPATASGTGAYDFVLSISGLGYQYVSKINDGAEPGFVYAGLQSVDANGNKYVQNMQDMTAGVCENTNRWNNGLGTAAKLYSPTASTATADSGTEITSGITIGTTADGVGSFALKDTRDGKRYVVRRLADGNCWMAQNLNLDLYTGMTLTSDDTNLTSGRESWVLTDAAGSNNEATMASNKSWGDLAWVPNAGSTSRAWQTTHGVETVTLTKYTYDGTEWQSSVVAECTGGTQQAPCYATATSVKYYRASDDVEATPAVALADEYKQDTTGSPWRGFSNGAYYATVTYQLKKVNANTSGSWSAVNEGTTCTFSYFWNHLKSGEACVLTTTGDTMLTQFSAGNSTIGLNSTEVPRMAITLDHTGTYTAPVDTKTQATYTGANTISFMNNTNSRTTMVASDANWTQYPMSGSAADYRWELNGRDGVHVLDAGPVYYNVTQTSPTTAPASYGGNNNCASIGTTQGTLKLNGNTLNFVSCLTGGSGSDSALALADTRVDGNWYNWYAAVAGSSISNFGNSGNDYYNAPDSICPKGWELPKDVGDDEISAGTLIDPSFYTLVTTNTSRLANFLGIDQAVAAKRTYALPNNTDDSTRTDYPLHAFPLSYVRSGDYYWGSGGLNTRGSAGYYWSAATYGTGYSRYLYFYASYLYPRGGNGKGRGFAVRCVAAQ